MKDMQGKELKLGDTIDVWGLRAPITSFPTTAGTKMVGTKYGDFNPSIVKVVEDVPTTSKETLPHEGA